MVQKQGGYNRCTAHISTLYHIERFTSAIPNQGFVDSGGSETRFSALQSAIFEFVRLINTYESL